MRERWWRYKTASNDGRVRWLWIGQHDLARIGLITEEALQAWLMAHDATPFDHNGECIDCDEMGTHAADCPHLTQRLP